MIHKHIKLTITIYFTIMLLTGCQSEETIEIEPPPPQEVEQLSSREVERMSVGHSPGDKNFTITDEQAKSLSKVRDLGILKALQPLIDKYKNQPGDN